MTPPICGAERDIYTCRRPEDHDGPHEDRLWVTSDRYFFCKWLDGGGGWRSGDAPYTPSAGVIPA